MKKILVTVKQIIEVPDSFKITSFTEPGDVAFDYIKIGKKLTAPDITWFDYDKVSGVGSESDELVERLAPAIVDYSLQEFSFDEDPNLSF
jgi:hypothetical protein